MITKLQIKEFDIIGKDFRNHLRYCMGGRAIYDDALLGIKLRLVKWIKQEIEKIMKDHSRWDDNPEFYIKDFLEDLELLEDK